MKLLKTLSLIAVAVIFFSTESIGQCNPSFDYSIESKTGSEYSLLLKKGDYSTARYTIQLYDLYQGKVIQEKSAPFSGDEKKVVFDKIKPSLYILYIKAEACKEVIVVGKKEGIKIGIN
jgi:hypothetical protein